MADRRVAPRFGSVFSNRRDFEDAVFAYVRGDIHVYQKKGCTESEHRILCRPSDAAGAVRCPAIYRIVKRGKAEGPGWRCIEAEPLHSDRCTATRRAELARENADRAQVQAAIPAQQSQGQRQQQQNQVRRPNAQGNARAPLPTPPVSAEPSANSLSPSARMSPAMRPPRPSASSPLVQPALQEPGPSQKSEESTLTGMSQLLSSSQA